MGGQSWALAGTLALLVGPWSGCGKVTQANPDAGDGSVSVGDPFVSGRQSFLVTAALQATGGATGSGIPPSDSFTLVLDAGAQLAIAGGNGRGAVVGITSADGRTFRSTGPFSVGGASDTACSGPSGVSYDSFEVTLAGGVLTGHATGAATISCGDCSFTVPFAATLVGGPDTTPPTLHSGAGPATPFDAFALVTSEPLPANVSARLVGSDGGAGIYLVPSVVDGAVPLVVGFSKPDVVLRAGESYHITLDGLVDFTGREAVADPPLRLASFPAAPMVPADGFESATGSSLGGAMVMRAGPLPAISGSTSLYIGSVGAPGLDGSGGSALTVKLARAAGETMLRFSYRMVGTQSPPSFYGSVSVGSEGASAGLPSYAFTAAASMDTLTVAGQTAYAGAVTAMSIALPDDATDQVLVIISAVTFSCGPLRAQNQGLLIDDLRLE